MAKGELSLTFDERDLAQVYKALEGLSQIEKNAIVIKGFQEAGAIVKRRGKSALNASMSKDPWNVEMRNRMAQKRGGSLANSIGTKSFKRKSKVHIGFKKLGHHAHLVNYGTNKRYKLSTGQYTGSVSKNAPNTGSLFWTKNFQDCQPAIKQKIIASIEASVKRMGWR